MQAQMRPARPSDMPSIQEIVQNVWRIGADWALEEEFGRIGEESWDRWLVPKVMSRLWAELGQVLVSESEGEVAGFISYAMDRAREVGSIHYNAVDPDYQGQGIGTAQVQAVLVLFRQAGMKYATVGTGLNEGHAPARHMYEKAGFKPVMEYRMYARRL